MRAQGVFTAPTNPPSNVRPAALKNVGIDQKLDNQLPLDLHFRDETGRDVRLGEYFGKRAVILTPVYYGCPMLCSQILTGLVSGLKPLTFSAGKEFDVIAVSFDPTETPQLARQKQQNYVARYGRAGSENGFHFSPRMIPQPRPSPMRSASATPTTLTRYSLAPRWRR